MSRLLIFVVLPLLTGFVVVVILIAQLLGRADVARGGDGSVVRSYLQRIRRRLGGCLAVVALVLVGGVVLNAMLPTWMGVPLALAPGLAASVALLGFAAWPSISPRSAGPVSASLSRREVWSYGSRRSFLVPAALAVAYVGLLAAAAAVASPDDLGLMRSFAQTQGHLSSSASPFPGSFYGVPLAAVTMVLAASTYAALRQTATSATIVPATDGDLTAIDHRWREIATRVIVRISTAALISYAGGSLLFAGSAMHRASDFTINGGHATVWSAVAWVVAGVGLVAILAATVVGGAAVAAVLSLREEAVRPSWIPTGQLR